MIENDEDDEASRTAVEPHQIDERDTVDAATKAGQAKARKEARRKKARTDAVWKDLLANEVGREVVWGLLSDAGTFTTQFACGPSGFPQPEATWFHHGQSSFGLGLYHKLLVLDVAAVRAMHEEHDPRFKGDKK